VGVNSGKEYREPNAEDVLETTFQRVCDSKFHKFHKRILPPSKRMKRVLSQVSTCSMRNASRRWTRFWRGRRLLFSEGEGLEALHKRVLRAAQENG
jgi:hypothetical protein